MQKKRVCNHNKNSVTQATRFVKSLLTCNKIFTNQHVSTSCFLCLQTIKMLIFLQQQMHSGFYHLWFYEFHRSQKSHKITVHSDHMNWIFTHQPQITQNHTKITYLQNWVMTQFCREISMTWKGYRIFREHK